ncbi:hypothetical protein V8C37DRAFT_363994 [Trichoderma ceciliae]
MNCLVLSHVNPYLKRYPNATVALLMRVLLPSIVVVIVVSSRMCSAGGELAFRKGLVAETRRERTRRLRHRRFELSIRLGTLFIYIYITTYP